MKKQTIHARVLTLVSIGVAALAMLGISLPAQASWVSEAGKAIGYSLHKDAKPVGYSASKAGRAVEYSVGKAARGLRR